MQSQSPAKNDADDHTADKTDLLQLRLLLTQHLLAVAAGRISPKLPFKAAIKHQTRLSHYLGLNTQSPAKRTSFSMVIARPKPFWTAKALFRRC
jgi:hypothetical protein